MKRKLDFQSKKIVRNNRKKYTGSLALGNELLESVGESNHPLPTKKFCEDCVGAIDGTIIPAWIGSELQNSYWCRKGYIAQNVVAACAFDMTFTFVVAGWEGSANDSRIFLNALATSDYRFPWPLNAKYYLVDAGFANFPGFLAPYKGERYHLPLWQGENNGPRSPTELFNKRHSSLRNHIERCFGILKKRFPILKGPMPNYSFDAQINLVMSCFVLHNFIRKVSLDDPIFHQFDDVDMIVEDDFSRPMIQVPDEEGTRHADLSDESMMQMRDLRDNITREIWRGRRR